MELNLVRPDISALETDALILLETEGGKRPELAAYSALYEAGEIGGKFLEFTLLHSPNRLSSAQIADSGQRQG